MVEKLTTLGLELINLFRLDYFEQFHIREMAKMLIKSHVTIIPHLKIFEKQKILNTKIIGKNKVYSLNFDNINTKNYLLLSENYQTILYLDETFIIKKITKEINNINLQGTIILFGSYAKKTFQEESDIDLFYLGQISDQNIQDIKQIGKIYCKIINIKKSSLNSFELGLKNKNPLLNEIIKNHIILQNPDNYINSLWQYYNEKR